MKIFIAGCARSGTTLMINLMRCFADTHVYAREVRLGAFGQINYTEAHCALKRRFDAYKTLPDLRADIELLYCVRHPFDCLTSTLLKRVAVRRFHVTQARWLGEYRAIRMLQRRQSKRRIYFLRYEDLVLRPDEVQQSIATHFGLRTRHRFSYNPWKPNIFQTSIEKWHSHPDYWSYFESLNHAFMRQISQFCQEFGYQIPTRHRPFVKRLPLDECGNQEILPDKIK